MGRKKTVEVGEDALITHKGKEEQQSFSSIPHFVNACIKQTECFCLDYKTKVCVIKLSTRL